MKSIQFVIKRSLIGTFAGRAAYTIRNLSEFFRTPKEAWGTVVNDQLASYLVARLCRPGLSFLDIGSHIGSVIAEVCRMCPSCSIHAFEAIPAKAENLRKKFPTVKVHEVALFEHDGHTTFYVDSLESGCSSLANSRANAIAIHVFMKRLDSIIIADDVDVIKIDVEGAELGVLKGAVELIKRCRPILMYESGPQNELGFTKEEMFQWLEMHQYQIFAPNRLASLGPNMDLQGYLDSHAYPRRTTNYFAIPVERRQEVQMRVRAL